MNKELMEAIIKHVFSNLAIIPSFFVDFERSKSLMTQEFQIPKKISFEMDDSTNVENNVWACQFSVGQQELKILLGDCSRDKFENSEYTEYCLLIQMKDSPTYGLYLSFLNKDDNMIACSLDGSGWMECQTYLQATFLAGMEQIKDMGCPWSKCADYQKQFDLMLSFIKFHDAFSEEDYEGQEN
jgi:hypothetical protein